MQAGRISRRRSGGQAAALPWGGAVQTRPCPLRVRDLEEGERQGVMEETVAVRVSRGREEARDGGGRERDGAAQLQVGRVLRREAETVYRE